MTVLNVRLFDQDRIGRASAAIEKFAPSMPSGAERKGGAPRTGEFAGRMCADWKGLVRNLALIYIPKYSGKDFPPLAKPLTAMDS
jgi:hypothetical protein